MQIQGTGPIVGIAIRDSISDEQKPTPVETNGPIYTIYQTDRDGNRQPRTHTTTITLSYTTTDGEHRTETFRHRYEDKPGGTLIGATRQAENRVAELRKTGVSEFTITYTGYPLGHSYLGQTDTVRFSNGDTADTVLLQFTHKLRAADRDPSVAPQIDELFAEVNRTELRAFATSLADIAATVPQATGSRITLDVKQETQQFRAYTNDHPGATLVVDVVKPWDLVRQVCWFLTVEEVNALINDIEDGITA